MIHITNSLSVNKLLIGGHQDRFLFRFPKKQGLQKLRYCYFTNSIFTTNVRTVDTSWNIRKTRRGTKIRSRMCSSDEEALCAPHDDHKHHDHDHDHDHSHKHGKKHGHGHKKKKSKKFMKESNGHIDARLNLGGK